METEETKESIDQPLDEESQDQPDVESEESENSDDEDYSEDDQPAEESEELSPAELQKGYMRESDYRRKTQELADMRREMEAMKSAMATPKADRTPEERQALETLEKLGIAKRDDVQAMINQAVARQRIMDEQAALRKNTGLSDDVINLAQLLAQSKGITVMDAIEQLRGDLGGKKPIAKKSLSAKGGVPTPSASMRSAKVKPLSEMSDAEFEAHRKSLGM